MYPHVWMALTHLIPILGWLMQVIECPECSTRYRLPDRLLHKRVKCKKCGKGFQAGGPPPAEEDSDLFAGLVDETGQPRIAPPPPPPPPPPDAAPTPERIAADAQAAKAVVPTGGGGMRGYFRDVGRSLLFFKGLGSVVTFVIIVVLAITKFFIAFAPCVALPGEVIISGWLMAFMLNVVASGASGETDLPDLSVGSWLEGIILPLIKYLLSWLFAMIPFMVALGYFLILDQIDFVTAIGQFGSALSGGFAAAFDETLGGSTVMGVLLLLSLATWPMFVLVVAVGGIPCLFRIDLMVRTVIRTLPAYVVVVVLAYLGVALPELVLGYALESVADTGSAAAGAAAGAPESPDLMTLLGVSILLTPLVIYFEIFTMRVIGLYYHHFKHRFAWSWG